MGKERNVVFEEYLLNTHYAYCELYSCTSSKHLTLAGNVNKKGSYFIAKSHFAQKAANFCPLTRSYIGLNPTLM